MEGLDKMELPSSGLIPESQSPSSMQQSSDKGVQNPNNSSNNIPVPTPQESDNSGRNKGAIPKSTTESISKAEAKKLRRTLASRESSQRYRLKQRQYINELEAKTESLRAELENIPSRIKSTQSQNSLLREENVAMNHKLSIMSGELVFKDAQAEELKKERDILRCCLKSIRNNCPTFSENSPAPPALVRKTTGNPQLDSE